jgi:hypothetical protein
MELPMLHALLIALTDPSRPEDLGAFNRWYDEVQIPAFLRELPATRRVVRYRASAATPAAAAQEYLALYELEFTAADGLIGYINGQTRALEQKKVGRGSPGGWAMNPQTARGAYYEQLGERLGPADFVADSVLLVHTGPVAPDARAEFERWYRERRLGQALAAPGIRRSTLYRMADVDATRLERPLPPWDLPNRYLALYELEGAGDAALGDAIAALRGMRDMWDGGPPPVDAARIALRGYTRIGEPRTRTD